jgi:hypothetical protein
MARVYALLYQGAIQTTGQTESPKVQAMADNCIRWFQACLSEAREMGARAMEGQILMGLGNALAMLDERDQAQTLLRQSVEVLEKVAANQHLEQAKASLKAV